LKADRISQNANVVLTLIKNFYALRQLCWLINTNNETNDCRLRSVRIKKRLDKDTGKGV